MNARAHGASVRRAATTMPATARISASSSGLVVRLAAVARPSAQIHHAIGCSVRGSRAAASEWLMPRAAGGCGSIERGADADARRPARPRASRRTGEPEPRARQPCRRRGRSTMRGTVVDADERRRSSSTWSWTSARCASVVDDGRRRWLSARGDVVVVTAAATTGIVGGGAVGGTVAGAAAGASWCVGVVGADRGRRQHARLGEVAERERDDRAGRRLVAQHAHAAVGPRAVGRHGPSRTTTTTSPAACRCTPRLAVTAGCRCGTGTRRRTASCPRSRSRPRASRRARSRARRVRSRVRSSRPKCVKSTITVTPEVVVHAAAVAASPRAAGATIARIAIATPMTAVCSERARTFTSGSLPWLAAVQAQGRRLRRRLERQRLAGHRRNRLHGREDVRRVGSPGT